MAGTTDTMEARAASPPIGRTRHMHDADARPVDYAAISAVWISILAGLVASTRGRTARDPITNKELIPLGAATFAVSKAVARERIGAWVRDPFVDESDARHPKGGRLKRALGELITCTRCVGTWSALAVVGLRVAHPEAGRTVSMILASSAANDWLQAGFKLLTEQTNLVGSRLPPRD